MKFSFDGARRKLAAEYNDLCVSGLSVGQQEILKKMRMTIIGLLCAYDEREQPGDCNMLADDIELKNP